MQQQTRNEPTDEQMDGWWREFDESETTLTIHQLVLLLSIEAGTDGCGVHEPIWPQIAEDPLPQISLAPGLHETQLLMMAQARGLERLEFIALSRSEQEGAHWSLTRKGQEAAKYWREALIELFPDGPSEPSTT